MSLSRRLLSMLPAIRRARTVPRKLTSTIRALGPWKYPKSLHQGKNEKNGIAEAIPFLSCPTMFSYRELPFGWLCFLEQGTGIEPASSAWEADVLPMNYICMTYIIAYEFKKEKHFIHNNRISAERTRRCMDCPSEAARKLQLQF